MIRIINEAKASSFACPFGAPHPNMMIGCYGGGCMAWVRDARPAPAGPSEPQSRNSFDVKESTGSPVNADEPEWIFDYGHCGWLDSSSFFVRPVPDSDFATPLYREEGL